MHPRNKRSLTLLALLIAAVTIGTAHAQVVTYSAIYPAG